jgi:hypothetical protein
MPGRGFDRILIAFAIVTSGFASRVARAETDPPADAKSAKVVVLADTNTDAIVLRIEAELRTLGFSVIVVRAGAEAIGPEPLESSARAAGAAAAIRVAPSKSGVDVWVVDRVTGKAVLRSVTADDAATIAVRAVELQRASPHPSRGEVAPDATVRNIVAGDRPPAEPSRAPPPSRPPPSRPPPSTPITVVAPPVERPAPVARREFGMRIGPGVLWSGGGLASTALLHLDGRAGLVRGLDLAVFGTIPLAGAGKDVKAGTFTTHVALAGAGVTHAFTSSEAWWRPSVGSGLALSSLHVVGTPGANTLASTEESVSAVPYLTMSFAIAPTSFLRIGPAAFAGIALERTKIDTLGYAVATFGRPIIEASFGAEVYTR